MPDYKEMYFQLAAKVANAIDNLVEAQQQGEYDYTDEETPVISLKNSRPEEQGMEDANNGHGLQCFALNKHRYLHRR